MRLPTMTKVLRGTLRPDRLVAREAPPLPLPRVISAPAWLSPTEQVIWRELYDLGVAAGVLGAQDLPLLAHLAAQESLVRQCTETLALKVSLTFVVLDGDGSPKAVLPWPELKLRAAALIEVRRLCEHFGFSPASRARVPATALTGFESPRSKLERFVNGG